MKFLLTCEHGGNEIPDEFLKDFACAKEVLDSHRGYDPGALNLFHNVKSLADFSKYSTTSRLIIELNRSQGHPQLFSEFMLHYTRAEKEDIISRYYLPYRNLVQNKIENWLGEGEKVFHLSIHTFTPVLNGKVRKADIGFLYDPSRAAEKELAKNFKTDLLKRLPSLHIRFNYPYLGTADGFTTYLRRKFGESYAGLELEVNQKFVSKNKMDPKISEKIEASLIHLLDQKRRQKD